jgi:hypothetical protein
LAVLHARKCINGLGNGKENLTFCDRIEDRSNILNFINWANSEATFNHVINIFEGSSYLVASEETQLRHWSLGRPEFRNKRVSEKG